MAGSSQPRFSPGRARLYPRRIRCRSDHTQRRPRSAQRRLNVSWCRRAPVVEPEYCSRDPYLGEIVDVLREDLTGVALRFENPGQPLRSLPVRSQRHRGDACRALDQYPIPSDLFEREIARPSRASDDRLRFEPRQRELGTRPLTLRFRQRDRAAVPVQNGKRNRYAERWKNSRLTWIAVLYSGLNAERSENAAPLRTDGQFSGRERLFRCHNRQRHGKRCTPRWFARKG